MALLIQEGGKTIPDALGEVREAADFCRYYAAARARRFRADRIAGPGGRAQLYASRPGAAFSSASARGIFRWRFSSDRFAALWFPAMP